MFRLVVGAFLLYLVYICNRGVQGSFLEFKPQTCAKDDDCLADQVCEGGSCAYICVNHSDCNPGEQCLYSDKRGYSYCRRDMGVMQAKKLMGKVLACMDFNTDLVGFTLPRGTLYGILTAEECSSKCQHTRGCQHWTWVGGKFKPLAGAKYEPFTCMLKRHDGGRKAQKHLISGSKQCLSMQ